MVCRSGMIGLAIFVTICVVGCEVEDRRSVRLPKGMRKMSNGATMAKPTGIAGGSGDIGPAITGFGRWNPTPNLLMLSEPVARYAEVIWDIDGSSNKERLRYMIIDAGYMLGDLESEVGYRRMQVDSKAVSEIYWEQAKAFAQTSHAADAIEALRHAIRYGMTDSNRMDREKELDSLRDTPEYKKIIELGRVRNPITSASAIRASIPRQPMYAKSDFQDFDEKEVELLPMIDDRAVIFHWATWSRPSREMLPVIEAVKQRFDSTGVKFFGIAYEPNGRSAREKVNSVLKEANTQFPTFLDHFNHGENESIYREVLPVTLVVDRKMQVLAKLSGYQSEEVVAGVLNNLSTVASETSSY
jgi:thiol-disulfide isomerase/thioredoxin